MAPSHVPRSTPGMPSTDGTVASSGGKLQGGGKRPEEIGGGEDGSSEDDSKALPDSAEGTVQPEPSQGDAASTAREESRHGVSEPTREDVLRAVDEIFHGVDRDLVSVGDVKRSIAKRFGWEECPTPIKNLVKQRLLDLADDVGDSDHEAGPDKQEEEESKSMEDEPKKEEQVPAPAAPCDCDADEVRRQYASFRSAPALFCSSERLRFVRLPAGWSPPALGDADGRLGEFADEGDREPLRYWPALVYNNIAELVRDLPSSESRMLKARLIVAHRRQPSTVVARLVGWRCDTLAGGCPGDESSPANFFPEPRLDIVLLSSPSVAGCESNGELVPFYERLFGMEEACTGVLRDELRRAKDATGPTAGGKSDGDKEEDRDVVNHATKFISALDVALNMLALDVGDKPLPPRPALIP